MSIGQGVRWRGQVLMMATNLLIMMIMKVRLMVRKTATGANKDDTGHIDQNKELCTD